MQRQNVPQAFLAILMMVCVMLLIGAPTMVSAADTGIIMNQRLNVFLELPTLDAALPAETARAIVAAYIATILADKDEDIADKPPHTYAQDLRKVLQQFPKPSEAKPVMVSAPDETERVARWLVGLEMGREIGGFFAMDPVDSSIQSPLMFTPDLKPLFRVPKQIWRDAPSVNTIPQLNELLPPITQFTTGIPIDPHAPGVFIIDGVLDLPKKTQEERREAIEVFNRGLGREAGVRMHHVLGRRTATSKCLAVASSYLADWWIVATGGTLPPYRNPVGGQQEYGVNPRHLESIYFERARDEAGIVGRAVMGFGNLTGLHMHARGNFKLVGRDRITREPIPYSPRGYARILSETLAGTVPDPLVPEHIQYEHGDNPFAMDEPPLLMVIDRNFMARRTRRKDQRRYDDEDDAYFQIAEWSARELSTKEKEQQLMAALHAWGPLYAQHMQRDRRGNPQSGIRAKGVHACVIVGYKQIDGRLHFIYRETFGNATHHYLEDSFLGPAYRAFPIEFFYQAIAFPHILQPSLSSIATAADGSLSGMLEVRTNRGTTLVSPDTITVKIDGQQHADVELTQQSPGVYQFDLPPTKIENARHVRFSVSKRYFTAGDGTDTFPAGLARRNNRWQTVSDLNGSHIN